MKQTDLGRGSRPSLAAEVVFPSNPPHKSGLSLPHTVENMEHLNGWVRWLCIAEDADIPDYNITAQEHLLGTG